MKKSLLTSNVQCLRFFFFGLSMLCSGLSSHAEVFQVFPPQGASENSIQKAIDQAKNGDVIQVFPGTYTENLSLWGKSVVLESKEGPSKTTIKAKDSMKSVVMINDSTIRGFTLTGGAGYPVKSSYGHDYYGGGVYAMGKSTIEDCIIHGNGHGTPKVNAGTFAGGVYAGSSAEVILRNSLLWNNFAWACGGAVLVDHGGRMRIENSTIFGNQSTDFFGHQGGVGMANGGKVEVVNSILWSNSGDEIGAFSGIYSKGAQAIVNYCLIQDEKIANQGKGNLSNVNPGFVNSQDVPGEDGVLGTADDGLRLMKASPAITKADSSEASNLSDKDIAGYQRKQGNGIDAGCYEFGDLKKGKGAPTLDAPKTGPGTPPDPDYKDTIAELKRLLAEKDKQLAHCEKEMDAKNKEVAELTSENDKLQGEVKSLNGKVAGLEKEVASLQSDNQGLQEQVRNLRQDNQNLGHDLATTTENLKEAVRMAETPFINGWVYDPQRGWIFTDAEHFPLVYTYDDQSWNYYELGSSNPRYFYNYTTQEWVAWDVVPSYNQQVAAAAR